MSAMTFYAESVEIDPVESKRIQIHVKGFDEGVVLSELLSMTPISDILDEMDKDEILEYLNDDDMRKYLGID